MEETKKISTVDEVIERFKKKESVVEFEGVAFKIRKLKAGHILFANGVLALPFMNGVVEKWNEMTKEEKDSKAEELMNSKEGQESVSNAILLKGVIEPPFFAESPAPTGYISIPEVEDDLKEFLIGKILKLSSLDEESAGFFRSSAS